MNKNDEQGFDGLPAGSYTGDYLVSVDEGGRLVIWEYDEIVINIE